MVEYTEAEQQEMTEKYSGLCQTILMTDWQLSTAQRREHDMIKVAVENKDRTINLVESEGFKWRIKSAQDMRTGKTIKYLEIWNPNIHFGFNFIVEGNWYD